MKEAHLSGVIFDHYHIKITIVLSTYNLRCRKTFKTQARRTSFRNEKIRHNFDVVTTTVTYLVESFFVAGRGGTRRRLESWHKVPNWRKYRKFRR